MAELCGKEEEYVLCRVRLTPKEQSEQGGFCLSLLKTLLNSKPVEQVHVIRYLGLMV